MNFPENEKYPYSFPIADTHAHYDDKKFYDVRDELLGKMKDFGVELILNNSIDCHRSAKDVLEMAKKYDICYAAIGVHPECLEGNGPLDKDLLVSLLKRDKVVALGEIGLDYHWSPETADEQKRVFCEQLEIAKDLGLPVTVHDREAHGDIMEILKKYRPKGAVHCFSGSAESAIETVKLGMYIGIGGVLTFNNARKLVEVAEAVPLERILLETDAPYLAPTPYRGKLCHSGMIVRVAEKLAQIKGIDTETVLKVTFQNAKELYGIK